MDGLQIDGVTKRFGTMTALDDITMHINPGELISFLGPSGCGKTTLLRIIAGFEHADDGTVTLDGKSLASVPANKRNMGMVFQSYSLFPNMTAAQNVSFGMQVRGRPRDETEREAKRLLEMVGLGSKGGNYPNQMSGGQQQRVALARALAIEPRVLLLDEPLSALDAKVRVSLREEIQVIQKKLGITTILVTHDQEEALTMSDRIAVFSVGRVEQFASPTEVYRNPATAFVASFVGEGNRFVGTVVDGGVELLGTRIDSLSTDVPVGTDVQVVVRPQDTRFTPREGAASGLTGTIVAQQFQGSTTRVIVALDGDGGGDGTDPVIADYPASQVRDLMPGSSVSVSFDRLSPLVNAL